MKIKFNCDSCSAYGSITIANKDADFEISTCPACGSDISDETDDSDE
jgi:transposase-like protein